jgi:hypothetical protein
MMCEFLAIKFLRHFASNKIELAAVLTHSWNPLSGAPHQIAKQIKAAISLKNDEEITQLTSALEVCLLYSAAQGTLSPTDGHINKF